MKDHPGPTRSFLFYQIVRSSVNVGVDIQEAVVVRQNRRQQGKHMSEISGIDLVLSGKSPSHCRRSSDRFSALSNLS